MTRRCAIRGHRWDDRLSVMRGDFFVVIVDMFRPIRKMKKSVYNDQAVVKRLRFRCRLSCVSTIRQRYIVSVLRLFL